MAIPQFSIKVRLAGTLGVLAVLLGALGFMSIVDLDSSKGALQDMHANKLVPAMALARGLDLLGAERTALHRAAAARDPALVAAAQKTEQGDDGKLTKLFATFHAAVLSSQEQAVGKRLDQDMGASARASV